MLHFDEIRPGVVRAVNNAAEQRGTFYSPGWIRDAARAAAAAAGIEDTDAFAQDVVENVERLS